MGRVLSRKVSGVGSLRNPIGPLPSSIYWRRRAVALVLLALLALIVGWALSLGGGGSSNQGRGNGGPASSITPGPTDSGPAISERPGGRDEVGNGGGSAGDSAGGSGSGGVPAPPSGSGGGSDDGAKHGQGWAPGPGSGTDAETSADGGAGGSGGGGSGSGGQGGGAEVAGLADCGPGDVAVMLNTVKDTYRAGEKPKFELTAKNSKGSACKIDLGRTASVVTVVDADDKKVWASDDCPREKAPAAAEVPANGESTNTLTWLRKPSSDNCGTPPASSAKPGRYEVRVALHGLKTLKTKFELA